MPEKNRNALPNVPRFPTSIEEVEAIVYAADGIAYFIDAEFRGDKINDIAQEFAGFDSFHHGPEGRTVLGLMMHIAHNFLPEASYGRFPQQDFLMQQAMLGQLAKDGAHQMPVVCLKLARKRERSTTYHEVRVYAHHVFSPKSEYLGTLCLVENEEISRKNYNDYARRNELVWPLPDDIAKMVQGRHEEWQKSLQQVLSTTKLTSDIQPEPKASVLVFSLDSLSEQEIDSLTVRQFLQAIQHTKDLNRLKLADDIAEQAIRATQKQIKTELKKRPYQINAKGKIHLRAVVQTYEKEEGKSYYGRLQADYTDVETGKDTSKQIRKLTPEEISGLKKEYKYGKPKHEQESAIETEQEARLAR